MTDAQLNGYIDALLSATRQERIRSGGLWADKMDSAMAMWNDRHPDTLPPAFEKLGAPPSCFEGTVPPIYDGDLE